MPTKAGISRQLPAILLALLLAVYAAALACLNVARFYGLKSNIMDIGYYTQQFWLLLHHGPALAADHFFPIIVALLPFYAAAPHPETLQILHVLLLTSAAIPIYLTARHWQVTPWLALAWSAAYLINPFVLGAAVWDFREISPAACLMGWALYATASHRLRLLAVMLFLLPLCKEHFGLDVAGFGLLWFALYRERRTAAAIVAFGLAAFLATLLVIMPALTQHAFMESSAPQEHYAWLFHPFAQEGEFYAALALSAILYAAMLLAPFWILPAGACVWLLPAMGDLAMNTLSSGGYIRSVFACHSAVIIPALTLAGLRASLALTQRRPKLRLGELTALVLISSLLLGYSNAPAPLPGARNLWEIDLHDLRNPSRGDVEHIRALFAPGDMLCLQSNIGGFFSDRAHMRPFPQHPGSCDGIILHLAYPFHRLHDLFNAPFLTGEPAYIEAVVRILRVPRWHITYWRNNWLVLQKNKPDIAVNNSEIQQALAKLDADYISAGKTAP